MSNMECSNYWINFIEKCLQNILKVDLSWHILVLLRLHIKKPERMIVEAADPQAHNELKKMLCIRNTKADIKRNSRNETDEKQKQ